MPSPILARADALMQRRRASLADGDDVPVLTDAVVNDEDDIPLLLDAETAAPPTAEQPATDSPPSPSAALREEERFSADEERELLIAALTERVVLRLQTEIPRLVAVAVREFLDEQQRQS
ncbi:MAG: hypothetical protein LWW83_00705 [Azonexaceae bacterium]|nr:hypothetical protein [Azonexaceae bacterium]